MITIEAEDFNYIIFSIFNVNNILHAYISNDQSKFKSVIEL